MRRVPGAHGASEREERQYRKILDLQGEITPERIKEQYRKCAAKYHPDQVEHLGPKLKKVAEQEMKDINKAYAYFKKKYDIN